MPGDSKAQVRGLLRLLFLWDGFLSAAAGKTLGQVKPRVGTITKEIVDEKREIWTGTVRRRINPSHR